MTVITRSVTNNLATGIEIFVAGYNTIKPSVIIPASTTTDLFTLVTGDELEAIQNQLAAEVALGNLTVSATVDTATFNPVGGGSGGITALTGDVTASGTGSVVATIATGHITPAKISTTSTDDFSFPGEITIVGGDGGGAAYINFFSTSGNYRLLANTSSQDMTFEVNGSIPLQLQNGTVSASARLTVGTLTADPSAVLTISSTTQGFLPPVMTTTQKDAIATPATGLVVYDSTLNKLSVWTGSAWETVTSV